MEHVHRTVSSEWRFRLLEILHTLASLVLRRLWCRVYSGRTCILGGVRLPTSKIGTLYISELSGMFSAEGDVLHSVLNICLCDDRLMRQLRKNRDDEEELMKNVPGWVTGTLWGEPTAPRVRGQFPNVHPEAFFVHNHPIDMYDHLTERKFH